MFDIFIENADYRKDVMDNSGISYNKLYQDQRAERPQYQESEVSDMVADCFTTIKGAAILLSANGLFLKYAGPTIRSNYRLVKIAVNQNGDAIRYADMGLLLNPEIAADLILSATVGYPCESYRLVVSDKRVILEVCKKILEMNPDMGQWLAGHMLRNDERMIEALASARRR